MKNQLAWPTNKKIRPATIMQTENKTVQTKNISDCQTYKERDIQQIKFKTRWKSLICHTHKGNNKTHKCNLMFNGIGETKAKEWEGNEEKQSLCSTTKPNNSLHCEEKYRSTLEVTWCANSILTQPCNEAILMPNTD